MMPTATLKNSLSQQFSSRSIFGGLVLVIILLNTLAQGREMIELKQERRLKDYHFFGEYYAGLEHLLKDVPVIGYYTERNLTEKLPSAQFAQAQLTLSPVILDPDSLDYEFILLDCTSPRLAFEKIKEMQATPLVINQVGVILTKKLK